MRWPSKRAQLHFQKDNLDPAHSIFLASQIVATARELMDTLNAKSLGQHPFHVEKEAES